MPQETEVTSEAVAGDVTENVVQEVAQNEHIAESKKYRKRAQDAENKLAAVEKHIATQEEEKLKQKEDFKTLYENVSSKNEALSTKANKWDTYEENKRTSLLDFHPDEDRDRLSKLDIETLEYITNKIKPNNPETIGRPKVATPPTNKPWAEMSDVERRDFYTFKANKKG